MSARAFATSELMKHYEIVAEARQVSSHYHRTDVDTLDFGGHSEEGFPHPLLGFT